MVVVTHEVLGGLDEGQFSGIQVRAQIGMGWYKRVLFCRWLPDLSGSSNPPVYSKTR